jgi:hypothetical protein
MSSHASSMCISRPSIVPLTSWRSVFESIVLYARSPRGWSGTDARSSLEILQQFRQPLRSQSTHTRIGLLQQIMEIYRAPPPPGACLSLLIILSLMTLNSDKCQLVPEIEVYVVRCWCDDLQTVNTNFTPKIKFKTLKHVLRKSCAHHELIFFPQAKSTLLS